MLQSLSQKNRFLQLSSPLGPDVLTPLSFSGTETLSQPFHYSLRVLSSDLNIDPKKLLHQSVTITLNVPGQKPPRYFNGLVHDFQGEEVHRSKRYYQLTLVPWFSCLQHATDCRIFLGKSVTDIFEQVSHEHGFFDFTLESIKGKHPRQEQHTQYNESAFHFLSRLLEEAGIFYFFRHTKDKHMMVLSDQADNYPACVSPEIIYSPNNERGQKHVITDWEHGYQLYSGNYSHNDYNYEMPSKGLQGVRPDNAQLPIANRYEIYNYPGQYQTPESADSIAKHRFHAQQCKHEVVTGAGTHSGFSAGSYFTLTQHPQSQEKGSYVLYQVSHSASDGSYLSALGAGGSNQHYSNSFVCFPKKVPFRPEQSTPRPIIPGPQTATVIGPEGDEIATDSIGRIQVQFHWIRRRKDKHDKQSCWVRVAQNWAGKGFGTWFLPRIGHEVVVHFIDGDPDRPLIIGSVYNPERKMPFLLPANKTRSGIQTRSSQGSGANILRFEDKKGEEEIYLEAEKNYNQHIKHDLLVTVNNDYSHKTKHDEHHLIGNDMSHQITNNVQMMVGQNSTQTIGKHLSIYSGQTTSIQAGEAIQLNVGGNTLQINPQGIFINGRRVKTE